MTGNTVTVWTPVKGEVFVHRHPRYGDRAWVLTRRAKHPDNGAKCLQVADTYLPLSECRPLGWTPRVGLRVEVTAQWSKRWGKRGTITRIGGVAGMPLAQVRIDGERSLFEAQLTWITPITDS